MPPSAGDPGLLARFRVETVEGDRGRAGCELSVLTLVNHAWMDGWMDHGWMGFSYVRMYVCMHVCTYVCMRAFVYVSVFLYASVHVCIGALLYVCVYVYVRT